MELPGKIAVHFLLDCLLFILLWLLLIRGRRRLRKWPLLCQYRYAHRGLHDLNAGIPENSLAAFRRAAQDVYKRQDFSSMASSRSSCTSSESRRAS